MAKLLKVVIRFQKRNFDIFATTQTIESETYQPL